MGQREKLEAGLEGLFSTVKQRSSVPEEGEDYAPSDVVAEALPEPEAPLAENISENLDESGQRERNDDPQHEQQVVSESSGEGATTPLLSEPLSNAQSAEVQDVSEASEPPVHLVVFALADEFYGIPIAVVERIITLQPITKVPRVPAFIKGLTNLRGTVFPVIDLRARFGLPAADYTKDSRIMVAEVMGSSRAAYPTASEGGTSTRELVVGLLVDAVMEVLQVPGDAIEPPSPIVLKSEQVRGEDLDFITGLAKVDERLIVILDLNKVLAFEV